MKTLTELGAIDDLDVIEFYLENLQSIYFFKDDIQSFEIRYYEPNKADDGLDDFEQDDAIFNYVVRFKIIIRKEAREMIPVMSLGSILDTDPEDNFTRLLEFADITYVYFYYKNDTAFIGDVPYDCDAATHESKRCKYYLDDEGNLQIELNRI
ncbi:MAG: hypothetical protein K6A63_01305 [Acholeplasmatales bacterium]|nr:hypothetical protein [Acholeplasmatales bacterium]